MGVVSSLVAGTTLVGVVGKKKTGVAEHLMAFDRAGLLSNGLPANGSPFIQSSDNLFAGPDLSEPTSAL